MPNVFLCEIQVCCSIIIGERIGVLNSGRCAFAPLGRPLTRHGGVNGEVPVAVEVEPIY
jgi:hypothetical protein